MTYIQYGVYTGFASNFGVVFGVLGSFRPYSLGVLGTTRCLRFGGFGSFFDMVLTIDFDVRLECF